MKTLFNVFHNGLKKTAVSISRKISSCFTGKTVWTEADYEQLEAALINADFGVSITRKITSEIKTAYEHGAIKTDEDILKVAKSEILKFFPKDEKYACFDKETGLNVLLLVGVNGCGKTTTAGKLTAYFRNKVLKSCLQPVIHSGRRLLNSLNSGERRITLMLFQESLEQIQLL